MFNEKSRQYLFRQSSGKVWNFYSDGKLGLCYRLINKRNTWTESIPILKSGSAFFSMEMDMNDRFHILYQDFQGSLFYALFDGSYCKITPILQSKSNSSYNKHLSIVVVNDCIYCFYILRHNNALILAHQTIQKNEVLPPKVVDYVTGAGCPYIACCDKNQHVYLFYRSSDGVSLNLGYRILDNQKNFWGDLQSIIAHHGHIEVPKQVVFRNDLLHLCYQKQTENRQYELVYQQQNAEKSSWSFPYTISLSNVPFQDEALIQIKDRLFIYWIRDDTIYYCLSSDEGLSFSKPIKYLFNSARQMCSAIYKSNIAKEAQDVGTVLLPAILISGLKLAFYQPESLITSSNASSVDDFRNLIVEGLKSINDHIEELEQFDAKNNDSIQSLMVSQDQLEKSSTKNAIKIQYLENEIRTLKDQMQEIKSVYLKNAESAQP